MNRTVRTILCVAPAGLLAPVGPASAFPDEVAAAWTTVVDKKDSFWATGVFATTDTAAPAGMAGAFATVPLGAGPHNWRFFIDHVVLDWVVNPPAAGVPGADNAKIGIKGRHLDGPHEEDIDPNGLPYVSSDAADIPFGITKMLAVSHTKEHPTAGEGNHFDHYGVRSWVTAAKDEDGEPPADAHTVGGLTQVRAKHTDKSKDSQPKWHTIGSTSNAGSTVSYDADTGMLRFQIGHIDELNSFGGVGTGIIEPWYADDPVRNGQMIATELLFLGLSGDGRFQFSGGHVQLIDPAGKFSFQGSFDEYLIEDTTRTDVLNSYGLLTHMLLSDVGDPADGPSIFLQDFWDINVFGLNVPEEEWLAIQGLDFAFATPVNIVDATNGFTTSMAPMPCNFAITCNAIPPSLSVPLTSFSVNQGTLLGGNLSSLKAWDDDAVEVLSAQQPNGQHRTQMIVRARSPLTTVDALDLHVVTGVNQANIKTKVWLWNFDTSRWVQIGQMAQSMDDSVVEFEGIANPNAYVRDSDGQIRVRVRMQGLMLDYPEGYTSRYNAIVINVR